MALSEIVKRVGKLASDNSPAILTAIGVTGTLTTVVLAVKAGMKAEQILQAEMDDRVHKAGSITRVEDFTPQEKVELTWTCYIPAAGSAVATIVCIILANRIGNRRAAALAAAYAISEKAFVEYKDKVVEKLGEKKEQQVRDEIAQDRITKTPLGETVIIGTGSVLCFESFTGRYFLSDMETIKKAQNDTNYQILNDYYASLTEFYNRVGLPRTAVSDEFGWNSDKMLELEFSTALAEDGRPCLSINFAVTPIRDYYRIS